VLSDHWYKNTELIEHVFSFVAPLAFAGLFLGLPGLADRLYRGFGLRITRGRARIVGYFALAIGAFEGVRFAIYLVR
jgi:hypothetical protein